MRLAGFWSSAKAWVAERPRAAVFTLGLVLFAAGLAWAWPPLGLIGPGAVLMAFTLFGGGKPT